MPEVEPSELIEMQPVRVDGVTGPANGTQFLLIKSLEDAETAEAEYLAKSSAKYTADQITALGKKGHAFKNPDGSFSYPIDDADDLSNAIKAVGRGKKAGHDAIRQYIAKRAKAMGKSDEIPDTWGADGSLSKEAAMVKCPTCQGKKTVSQDGTDEECPMCKGAGQITEAAATTLAKDDGTATATDQADATIPGSAAWETQDAEALIEAGQMLANAATMLNNSANRERIEVATGHADDMGDVYDLSDAVYAVQSALSIVARVAFTEEAEAQAAGEMAKQVSPETIEAVRQTVEVLQKALGDGAETGNAGEGGDAMSIEVTTEELGALIKSGVEEALPAAVDAALAKSAAEAEKVAAEELAKATADLAPLAGLAPEVLAGLEEMAKSAEAAATATDTGNEALIKSIVDANRAAITEEVAPLTAKIDAQDAKIEELSKAARPGGPRVSVPGTGRSNDAAGGQVDISELEERFEKALPGSVEKADLGERITKMRLLHEYGVPVKSATA